MPLQARVHNPFAKKEDYLYMLIDVSSVEATRVLKVGTMRQVQLLGQLYAAEGKTMIAPPIEGRGFSKLEPLQLQYLYWNMCQLPPPDDYGKLVQDCLAVVKTITPADDHVPSLEYLVSQLTGKPYVPVEPEEEGAPAEPAPVVRPKGTSTTGIIWTICDEVVEDQGMPTDAQGWKDLRAEVVKRCHAEDFNDGTISVQYSKWKKSKSQ